MESSNGNQTPRGNGTRVTREVYSKKAVERVKRLVENFYISGEEKYYAILVDGETVISKTSDPDRFDNYLEFVHDLTQEVVVRLFFGNSPNCNTYRFSVVKNEPLSGIAYTDQRVAEALEKDRNDRKIADLNNENQRLRRKVAKLKGKLDKNSTIFSKKNAGTLKELAGHAVSIYQQINNPTEVRPALSGADVGQQAEISFDAEVDEENLKMLELLEEKFGAEYTRGVLNLVSRLARHEDLVAEVSEVLYERESRKKSKK